MVAIISLATLGCLCLFADVLPKKLFVVIASLIIGVSFFGNAIPLPYTFPMVKFDTLSARFSVLLLFFFFMVFTSLMLFRPYTREVRLQVALMAFATAGGVVFLSFDHVVTLFLGIEMMSIPVYILCAGSANRTSWEAGLKYFILGSFSSAILLFGIALMFLSTRHLYWQQLIIDYAQGAHQVGPLAIIGLILVLTGLCFKIGVFPFQSWLPDVYDGAPTVVTAFMATIVKTAAVAGALRVVRSLGIDSSELTYTVTTLAILTILWGNIGALRQTSFKRLLAYSSISHSGFLLLLVLYSLSPQVSVFYYLLSYGLASFALFVPLIAEETRTGGDGSLKLALSRFGEATKIWKVVSILSLLSLAGIPPLAGFLAKFFVLVDLTRGEQYGLLGVVLINAAIAVYYYGRLIPGVLNLSFHPSSNIGMLRLGATRALGMTLLILIVLLGIFPSYFM